MAPPAAASRWILKRERAFRMSGASTTEGVNQRNGAKFVNDGGGGCGGVA